MQMKFGIFLASILSLSSSLAMGQPCASAANDSSEVWTTSYTSSLRYHSLGDSGSVILEQFNLRDATGKIRTFRKTFRSRQSDMVDNKLHFSGVSFQTYRGERYLCAIVSFTNFHSHLTDLSFGPVAIAFKMKTRFDLNQRVALKAGDTGQGVGIAFVSNDGYGTSSSPKSSCETTSSRRVCRTYQFRERCWDETVTESHQCQNGEREYSTSSSPSVTLALVDSKGKRLALVGVEMKNLDRSSGNISGGLFGGGGSSGSLPDPAVGAGGF